MHLTEENGDIKRDLELTKRELKENTHWVDNQADLMDMCNDLADQLRAKEEELKHLKDLVKSTKLEAEPQQLNTTNANLYKHLFKN